MPNVSCSHHNGGCRRKNRQGGNPGVATRGPQKSTGSSSPLRAESCLNWGEAAQRSSSQKWSTKENGHTGSNSTDVPLTESQRTQVSTLSFLLAHRKASVPSRNVTSPRGSTVRIRCTGPPSGCGRIC